MTRIRSCCRKLARISNAAGLITICSWRRWTMRHWNGRESWWERIVFVSVDAALLARDPAKAAEEICRMLEDARIHSGGHRPR